MKYYEAIFIAHPSLEDSALAKLVNETKEIFLKRGGEIIYEEDMGKKRLAYPIARQRFGNYQLLHLQSEDLKNTQLNRDLEHKDDILAHMIVRIDKDQVLEPQPKPEAKAEAETIEGAAQEKAAETVKNAEAPGESTDDAPATAEDAKPEPAEAESGDSASAEAKPAIEEEPVAEDEPKPEEEPAAEDEPKAEEEPAADEEPKTEKAPVEEESAKAEPAE